MQNYPVGKMLNGHAEMELDVQFMVCIYFHRFRETKFLSIKLLIFSYPSVLRYGLGAQKNCLIEKVLLSTHNICFGLEIRIKIFWYPFLTKALASTFIF